MVVPAGMGYMARFLSSISRARVRLISEFGLSPLRLHSDSRSWRELERSPSKFASKQILSTYKVQTADS